MFPNRIQPMENEAGGALPNHSQDYFAGNRSISKQFTGNSRPMAQSEVNVGASQTFGSLNKMTAWHQNKLYGRTEGSFINFGDKKEHPHVDALRSGEISAGE